MIIYTCKPTFLALNWQISWAIWAATVNFDYSLSILAMARQYPSFFDWDIAVISAVKPY